MRLLYDIFFIIFTLFYIPYLLLRGKLHRDFPQKFGFLNEDLSRIQKPVWIHAVSVGEAALAAKLAAGIKEHFPGQAVVVSTTTRTGNDMIRKLGKGVVDGVFYYPVDIRAVVSKVVKKIDPKVYVMIETELWPNLLEGLYEKEIPVVLVNGRISEGSFKNYKKIGFVTKRLMRCIDAFYMQSAKDAERIKQMGATEDNISVVGNMKFDEKRREDAGKFTKEELGFSESDEVIVAGSTHYPEEQLLIDMYKELKPGIPSLKLILAPRHIERVDAIRIYLDKKGLNHKSLSGMMDREDTEYLEYDVLLVDTIGNLKELFAIATAVFMGKSLVAKGGQNPIEPAVWGKPVIFGENMSNFREISSIFLENDAAIMVKNEKELKDVLGDILRDKGKRDRLSENACRIIDENSGAVKRTLEGIEKYLR